MGWSETLSALRRRWYVALFGLLATAGLAVVALQASPPTYEARGSILLLPPTNALAAGQNPLLQLSNLDAPASIVSTYLDGDEERTKITKQAPDATWTIEMDLSVRGPVILITVEDLTASSALSTLHLVLDSVPSALDDLQHQLGVDDDAVIGSMPLAVDTEATTVTRGTIRALVAAAGAGLVLTVAGTVGIDTLLRRRTRLQGARRSTSRPRGTSEPADGGYPLRQSVVAPRQPSPR